MDAFFLKKEIDVLWDSHVSRALDQKVSSLELPAKVFINGVATDVVEVVYDGTAIILKVDNEQNSN